ncbi:MAG: hypothetical protein MJZ01_00185 [Bacteroidales bacterium]|nr:hypothetical protein [Bacteroidales bacterium]
MKKHLIFALGLSIAACSLTACHDDDGDDENGGNVVSDYSANVQVMTMPTMFSNFTDNLGAAAYMLSDGNINVFTYVSGTSAENPIVDAFNNATGVTEEGEDGEESVSVEKTALSNSDFPAIYEAWYGGFTATWPEKEDGDWYDMITPIDGTYANNYNCLIANPGTVCKAIFTKNLSSLMANISMKKAVSLNVQAPMIYKYLKDAADGNADAKSTIDAWDIQTLPANTKIEVIVYGYVESFNMTSIKNALASLKNAAAGAAKGGKELGRVTLIETDAEGKVTTLCDKWKEIKFASQTYLGEVYIKASTNGKDVTADFFTDAEDGKNNTSWLNNVLVDKIAFEGRSLFGK